ncbi:hypothetical protein Tco_0712612 [Tanacetum coccineum]
MGRGSLDSTLVCGFGALTRSRAEIGQSGVSAVDRAMGGEEARTIMSKVEWWDKLRVTAYCVETTREGDAKWSTKCQGRGAGVLRSEAHVIPLNRLRERRGNKVARQRPGCASRSSKRSADACRAILVLEGTSEWEYQSAEALPICQLHIIDRRFNIVINTGSWFRVSLKYFGDGASWSTVVEEGESVDTAGSRAATSSIEATTSGAG